MVRIAATGDLHIRERGCFSPPAGSADLKNSADLLIVAGDITENGRLTEAAVAAEWFASLEIPVIAVLGNHDRRGMRPRAFRQMLEQAGVTLLDGQATTILTRAGERAGIAGVSGSGGGFAPLPSDPTLPGKMRRAVLIRARREAMRLEQALASLDTPIRIALTHFAPVTSTLGAEPFAKWWMLGSCELATVIDRCGVDLVVHGHAHLGNQFGITPAGIPVRNVALPVNQEIVEMIVDATDRPSLTEDVTARSYELV